MTEKRYYKKNYEESYYIFDSKTLTEKEFEKKVEYDGYDVFSDSLTPYEVVDLLNENEQLKQERINGAKIFNEIVYKNEINALKKENEKLKHELLCKQLDKAPTEPINCKCYYKELKE